MKQGTVSIVAGCHSPIHYVLVYLSWVKLYGVLPSFRETTCIFIHDIGHYGKDYLDHENEKKAHWELGAKIAKRLFGQWGYNFVAGHCSYSGVPLSPLYKADKYSWYIAPYWWLWTNNITEPGLTCGLSNHQAILDFRKQVRESIESGAFASTHGMYMKRRNERKVS